MRESASPAGGGWARSSFSCGEPLVVDADALVGDGEHVAVVARAAGDDDGGRRRRERGRVLEQLGEEVGDVGDGVAGDGQVGVQPDVA